MRESRDGVLIDIVVQPGAKKSVIVGAHGNRLKVSVNQPPDKGRANDAVIALLAETLDVAKSSLTITQGQTSRQKTVCVQGLDAATITVRLGIA
jgi:uncharacterized protein